MNSGVYVVKGGGDLNQEKNYRWARKRICKKTRKIWERKEISGKNIQKGCKKGNNNQKGSFPLIPSCCFLLCVFAFAYRVDMARWKDKPLLHSFSFIRFARSLYLNKNLLWKTRTSYDMILNSLYNKKIFAKAKKSLWKGSVIWKGKALNVSQKNNRTFCT